MIKFSEYLNQKGIYRPDWFFLTQELMDEHAQCWRNETLKPENQPIQLIGDERPKIKCLRDVILVEPGEADEMVNGLIMPENTRDKPMRGTVLAVGPGKDEKPMTVKVGDVVFYSRHAGVDVIHEEKECLLMRETDVFAVL